MDDDKEAREHLAALLENLATLVRNGTEIQVALQAIWDDGDGHRMVVANERTEGNQGSIIQLLGLLELRKTALATSLNLAQQGDGRTLQ